MVPRNFSFVILCSPQLGQGTSWATWSVLGAMVGRNNRKHLIDMCRLKKGIHGEK